MRKCRSPVGEPDVWIIVEVCETSPSENRYGPSESGAFEISVAGLGRYLIRAGREIRLTRPEDASDDELRAWLLGPALATLLHQRGALPLHASAVVVDRKCVAFVGPCGAGKSTICAFLAQRGYAVASDDVLAISRGPSGMPQAGAGSSSVRLMADSLAALGANHGEHYGRGLLGEKRVLHMQPGPVRLMALQSIYALEDSSDCGHGEVVKVSSADALKIILDNISRPEFANELGCFECTFALAATVASQVTVYRLLRPRTLSDMATLLDLLETHWFRAKARRPRRAFRER